VSRICYVIASHDGVSAEIRAEHAELRSRERRRLIGHQPNDALEVELRCERGADALERFDERCFIAQSLFAEEMYLISVATSFLEDRVSPSLMQLEERAHLGNEHVRLNRLREVIDRTVLVAERHAPAIGLEGGDKDDRDVLVASSLANEAGSFDSSRTRHDDIEENEGDGVAFIKEMAKGFIGVFRAKQP
jgi:hypothetical protein